MCQDSQNKLLSYVKQQDISSFFPDQTVVVLQAPSATKMEVDIPSPMVSGGATVLHVCFDNVSRMKLVNGNYEI